jgi:FAD/FMN-containing dehydrogenase
LAKIIFMNTEALTQLASRLRGTASTPSDASYDEARRVWNGTVDKTPAVIVTCQGVADVIDAVNFARDQALHVAVRGGGHHVAGSAVIDAGLVIDLSQMRSVRVDSQHRRVRAEGGAQIGDVDRETQAFGLAVPLGLVSETGIAGLTLAGGLGWMRRKHGLSCDNLKSADVVLSDGRYVHASAEENQDLLWALRGGGWDLGVVTSFEFEAHQLGPEVFLSFVTYARSEGKQVLQLFQEAYAAAPLGAAPLGVCWTFPEAEVFPKELWGQQFVAVVGVYAGPAEEGAQAMQPFSQLGTVLTDMSGPVPYIEAQRFFDEDYPKGRRYYWRSSYLKALSGEAIDVLLHLSDIRPSPLSSVDLWPLGGAIAGVPASESPFGHRDAPFAIGIEANWDAPSADAANIAWARQATSLLEPFSTGGSYMNFEDPDDTKATAASFGENLQRLVQIKRKYDPANLFRSRRGLVD